MKLENSYELHFSGLKAGNYDYNWKVDESFLIAHGVEDFSEVRLLIQLNLEKKERLMELNFNISGTLTTLCDRCGDEVNVEINTNDDLVIRFAHANDFTDDLVVFLDETEHKVDVGQFIYEYIMVGLPSRFVHPVGKCNKEVLAYLEEKEKETEEESINDIDPRWEALKKLKQ